MASKIQNRRDTAANWSTYNPILAKGEIGLEADSMRFKWGDGVTSWNSLPYAVNTFLTGTSAPTSSVGKDGDCYMDVSAYAFYGPKTNGAWDDGISIITRWLHGTIAPTADIGIDDDHYLNITTSDIYHKSDGMWMFDVNIKGLKGDTGNGVASVAKTGSVGLTDTYTITYTNGATFNYSVDNGKSITNVSKTSSNALVDTYTITFNNNTSTTYTVTNSATWYSGSATPTNASGIDGDFFLNNTTYDVLKKIAGAWTVQTNIKGLKGDTGSGYTATSATSLTITANTPNGSTSLTTQAGLAYTAGARVRVSSTATPTTYAEGIITAYAGTDMTVNIDTVAGSGTYASWNINTVGQPAGAANTGALTNIVGLIKGSGGVLAQASANTDYVTPSFSINAQTGTAYTLTSADCFRIVTVSNAAAITLTLTAAATLGAGWNTTLINVGTSTATIAVTGADTIDGVSSFVLAPNNAINIVVNAAGSFKTYCGNTNNVLIKGYRESCYTATITTTFNFGTYVGRYTSFNLTGTSGSNIVFTMPPVSSANESLSFQLFLRQPAAAVTIAWNGGAAPVFISSGGTYNAPASGKAQLVVFTSMNGSPWYASVANSGDIQ